MIPFIGLQQVNKIQQQMEKLLGISKFQFSHIWDRQLTIISNYVQIDIIKLDEFLDHNDPEYDDKECMYKGESCSLTEYITKKFGKEANSFIDNLI